ncbi:hypothetical protein B0H10DRAFT_110761 [Mycena sp. CBHHK59/15]|nr:hypothetical protein B0H10DRAFT_110761 [Mycena sp. CBHHK59/15]
MHSRFSMGPGSPPMSLPTCGTHPIRVPQAAAISQGHNRSHTQTNIDASLSLIQTTPAIMKDASVLLESSHRPIERTKTFLRGNFLLFVCFCLHGGLVLFNVALLITGLKSWEHRITFPLARQTTVSFWATALTTAFGTIYSSLLVFLTQKMAMRRNIQSHQTLTATHDSVSSWAGLGSAVATLYNQLTVPSSILGSLNVAGYLGCIALLHIVIPASLSVQTSLSTMPFTAPTFAAPEFDNSATPSATREFMTVFPPQLLQWRGIFESSNARGLLNGSLYEVLQNVTLEEGEALVSAVGFNITCGYLPAVVNNAWKANTLNISLGAVQTAVVGDLYPNLLSVVKDAASNFLLTAISTDGSSYTLAQRLPVNRSSSIIIYTSNLVVDSQGHLGDPLILNNQYPTPWNVMEPLNFNVSQLQFLQCSKSLVPQLGTVDSQSNTLRDLFLDPSVHKTHSIWAPASDLNITTEDQTLLGGSVWSDVLSQSMFSGIDEYLMTYLKLDPLSNSTSVLNLHDIENGLSTLAALIFWLGASIKPEAAIIQYSALPGMFGEESNELLIPPVFAVGTTSIHGGMSRVRLNISSIAVSLALGASIVLMILCVSFFSVSDAADLMEGMGVLHHIWLWRSHPEPPKSFGQVENPTKFNLRTAGSEGIQLSEGLELRARGYLPVDKRMETNQVLQRDSSISSVSGTAYDSASINYLKVIVIGLHALLVLVHLALLGIFLARKEHSIVFAADLQPTVSLWFTITTTAFGTIYYSLLVYLTQKLAITGAVQTYSILTATHDKIQAWAGVGSAVLTLYKQLELPASFLSTLSICAYLSSISILQITTPALFSVEAFNTFGSVITAPTIQSVPDWGDSPHSSTVAFVQNSGGFLPWIGSLDDPHLLGLSNGTLYDVLTASHPTGGTAEVSALGFKIRCGYIPDAVILTLTSGLKSYNFSFPSQGTHISPMNTPVPNSIMITPLAGDTIILYTANTVFDSENTAIPSAAPIPDSNVSLHFLQCSRSLIPQRAQVKIDSRVIIPGSLDPSIEKIHSQWKAYESRPTSVAEGSRLVESDYWSQIVSSLPLSGISLQEQSILLSWGDVYLNQQLGLNLSALISASEPIYLHDVENGLSRLVASVFWIGGHVNQTFLTLEDTKTADGTSTVRTSPPNLGDGNAVVQQVVPAARLDMSHLAITAGLSASIVLLLLAVALLTGDGGRNGVLDGMGLLQIIWLFERHTELCEILEQVEEPSEYNLRKAGWIKVRLVDPPSS